MKAVFYILCIFNIFKLFAQDIHDEKINALVEQYTKKPELKSEILVHIDIEGMHIPDKKIYVDFRKDKKPKVKGEGLALLPKKGTVDQFNKLLSSSFQAIYLSKNGNNLEYKLVSLDPKSDWITADIIFDENTYLIYTSNISTRKFGSFETEHSYNGNIYPSRSIITFDIKKFKIPLRFIGREQEITSSIPQKDKNVQGKITLTYTYL
jgi:hypothetical protein